MSVFFCLSILISFFFPSTDVINGAKRVTEANGFCCIATVLYNPIKKQISYISLKYIAMPCKGCGKLPKKVACMSSATKRVFLVM